MPLVGNLRDFALHDFLYLVDRGYKTGGLLVDQPVASDAAQLFFDKGKLLAVMRPHRRERLGELLVRIGKISPPQLHLALQTQQMGGGLPIGQILVEQRAIEPLDLQTCIRQQIEETVYELFAWREGEFRFLNGQRPALDDVQAVVPLPVESLIMEGVRRVDEMARIREHIPSNDMLVRFADNPREQAPNVNLSADEWRVFARINGRSTVNEIAARAGMTTFQVSTIIVGFILSGLVQMQPAPERERVPAAVERVAAPADSVASEPDHARKTLVNRLIDRIRS
jgi:hypothetical protein